jgi:hypothetical protein
MTKYLIPIYGDDEQGERRRDLDAYINNAAEVAEQVVRRRRKSLPISGRERL